MGELACFKKDEEEELEVLFQIIVVQTPREGAS
ncbi:uncharacterized protein G2W53_019831 [Senna tora]|uniref:Uncharacterized protein n=1 Tax=Senna tora TaxID=362788 RepID=A0A834WMQ9_9FABA|nr:uncharacterized protein G2W53_019831 [Senna tora]